MKQKLSIIAIALIFLTAITKGGTWTQKTNYASVPIRLTTTFTIGQSAYLCTGFFANSSYLKEVWEYNYATDAWTQKTSFYGTGRYSSFSFAINGIGYLGAGRDGSDRKDFWAYDPVANIWAQKTDYPMTMKDGIGFSINNFGYVALGDTNSSAPSVMLWQYNPVTDTWLQKADFPGVARSMPRVFVINSVAYVGTGGTTGGPYYQDMYAYDAALNQWTAIAPLPLTGRTGASAFTANNKGYIVAGYNGTTLKSMCAYDPSNNTWAVVDSFPGTARWKGDAMGLNGKGYFGLGYKTSNLNDWWEYTPDSTTSISDLQFTNDDLYVTPNPAKDFIKVSTSNQQKVHAEKITIADVAGKIIYTSAISGTETVIDVKHFAKGVYTVKVDDGKQRVVRKFLKE